MTRPYDVEKVERVYKLAREASSTSYSPYSGFPVGAAVLTRSGKVYRGANVENASYGLTICAERVAIHNAITAGDREIEIVAIYAEKGQSSSPCGACRQVIAEFGKDILVAYREGAELLVTTVASLLPSSFEYEEHITPE